MYFKMRNLLKIQATLFLLFSAMCAYGQQSDTLNRVDKFGKKYGSWEKYDGKTLLWKGRFYNGEPVGEFIYYHKNKQIERRLFYHPNSPKVSCVSYYTNGRKSSEGVFINKERDGKWLYYNTNGHLISEENYVNGKKHGKFKIFTGKDEILIKEETWNNNVLDGEYNTYYITGVPRIKMFYVKGKMHGDFENYYEDGKLWNRGQYKDDFRNGTWIAYNREGNEIKVQEIEMGRVRRVFLGFQTTAAQWLKIDVNRIAYIYQSPSGLVLQLKDKKRIPLSDANSLTTIASTAGMEYLVFINENVLSNYDAIKKMIPTDKDEAKVILKPDPPFEVYTYDDYYQMLKAMTNPDPPKE